MAVLERFIRNSDNQVKLILTEDGSAISGTWTGLDIHFGGLTISRTADGNGVTLNTSTGALTINPGDLTDPEKDLVDALQTGNHRVQIVVTSATNDDGAVFGGAGSTAIYFHITDKPA